LIAEVGLQFLSEAREKLKYSYVMIVTKAYILLPKKGSVKINSTALYNYTVLKLIKIEPTANVQEVRHGKWIEYDNGVQTCSECGEEHEWQDYRASYCEDCGAKMDKE
jgi:hypothetical protein